MKKLLFSILLAVNCSITSHSQIDGGTMMAGGSLYFNRYANKDLNIESTSFNVSPQFGLAFADNFIAGAWFSFSTFSNVSNWSVAPFVRYYMKNFFLQAQYGYTRSGSIGSSIFGTDLGYAMFLNDNVALEPAFYYNQYFNSGLDGYDLGFKIGFQVYFNR